jgi:hypothetical protein
MGNQLFLDRLGNLHTQISHAPEQQLRPGREAMVREAELSRRNPERS